MGIFIHDHVNASSNNMHAIEYAKLILSKPDPDLKEVARYLDLAEESRKKMGRIVDDYYKKFQANFPDKDGNPTV